MNAALGKNYLGSIYEIMTPDVYPHELFENSHHISEMTPLSTGWFSFYLSSDAPLIDDDYDKEPPFKYYFMMRTSKNSNRFLLVSTHEALNNLILKKVMIGHQLSSVKIHVADLVKSLTAHPDIYCLGVVFAKVDGFGKALRSMSLYGDDLAQAKLFKEILPKLVAYRTHLKEVRSGKEILQVGSRGEIGFHLRDLNSLYEIDLAIKFLNNKGFLLWDISADLQDESL